MSQLQINVGTRDLTREGGSFVRTSGPPEIRQHVALRLGLFRGECFLAASRGMRFVGLIYEKGTSPQLIENECAETILGTPGVATLVDIEITGPNSLRHATVTWAGLSSLDDFNRRAPIHDTIALAPGRSDDGA
jgi:hypothetical protein